MEYEEGNDDDIEYSSDKAMSDDDLAAFLDSQINDALNQEGDELSENRQTNINAYDGDPDGHERKGFSQVQTREVFETVEWALPSLVRVFTGDRALEFTPMNRDDETAAAQETDSIHYMIYSQENGFLATYQLLKDALINPNGYAKVWTDEVEETTVEEYARLTIEQVGALAEADGVEITEQEEVEGEWVEVPAPMPQAMPQGFPSPQMTPGSPPQMIRQQEPSTYNLTARVTNVLPKLRYEAVPPEEVLVAQNATSIDLDDAEFVAHVTQQSWTDLINSGYDEDMLDQATEASSTEYNDERTNRADTEDENPERDDHADPSMRKYWVEECYARVDYNGDGLAERRRIVKIGNDIFENDEDTYQPLVALTSILQSHRHVGMALIESVKELQLASTALYRQLMTNLYRIGVPRKYVGERAIAKDGTTMAALQNYATELIPCRDATAIVPEVVQPLGQVIMPVMDKMKDMTAMRTGVNPQLSLDPAVLQQSTVGAFTAAQEQASQRLELMVRLMGETGFKQIVRKVHRQMRENFGSEISMKLSGSWVDVNPREWAERTNITVKAGIGNKGIQDKVAALSHALDRQMQLQQQGAEWVTPSNIYATFLELMRVSGVDDVERFMTDPATIPPPQPQQPPVDPVAVAQAEAMKMDGQSKVMGAQIKGEELKLKQQEARGAAEERAVKRQLEIQADMQKAEIAKREHEAKVAYERAKAQMEASKLAFDNANTAADTALKEANVAKTQGETRELEIDNRAAETGVLEAMNRMVDDTDDEVETYVFNPETGELDDA